MRCLVALLLLLTPAVAQGDLSIQQTSLWSEWRNLGYSLFPPGIEIEWKNGKWTPKAESLKAFSPGPGPSILQRNPQANDAGLPPGMTRA